ncbi:MAG: 4Fe-4S dicluster domain-containing protein [Armatimonadota bacterium]|nr:4Fe-4S dicluster domain-containing protein [bacterium]
MRRIRAIPEVCIGCGLCKVWCKVEHSSSKNIHKAFKANAPETMACVEVEEEGCESFASQCRHCDEPLCVYGCITGAMSKNAETGLVTVDQSKCVGCWTCVLMCPNGAIRRDERGEKRVAIKCDQCMERGFPSCVEHCPNDALVLEDTEDE